MTQKSGQTENSRGGIIALPFGRALVGIPVHKAIFFPGAKDYIIIFPELARRAEIDGYALMVYPNPQNGIASGIATLAKLEVVAPFEGTPNFRLGCNFIARVLISDPRAVPDPSGEGTITELRWELLTEKEISVSAWNSRSDVREQLFLLRKAVKEILDRAPDAIEEHLLKILRPKEVKEYEITKTDAILKKVATAFDALKRPRRELLGQTLDGIAHSLFELYYLLKEEKPTKEGLKLVSNVFHTVLIEERLRRLLRFAEWFVYNFDPVVDGEDEEEGEEPEMPVAVNDASMPPRIAALLQRYQSVRKYMPEEARREFEHEFQRLTTKAEEAVITRLDWIAFLPWEKRSSLPTDLQEVKRMLDEDHAHLRNVKDRIVEYVAVRMLNPRAKGKVLCFVGPRGVGKTSLGKSIARSLGKKFMSLSLGGIDDVADLRGHHYTYSNAAPGFIMKRIRDAGERDCVFMLDEVDKTQKNWRGDPAAALLEILDPEQNHQFRDHYIDVPFDLSEVLFITTANILATINSTLMDRLEIIEIPGYTELEKLEIAQNYLIPRRRKENGFPITQDGRTAVDVVFTEGAIKELINSYTREAGVRWLERELDMPFRKVATAFSLGELGAEGNIEISEASLRKYCGRPRFSESDIPSVLPNGTVPMLAVSETGGWLFMSEANINRHPGKRKIVTIGVRDSGENKDDVNKIDESVQKVFGLLTSDGRILFETLRAIEEEEWKCPIILAVSITNGATPKDGPSGGLSVVLAEYGALMRKSIKPCPDVPLIAATGEIEANLGTVGKIGGLRDKILVAARHGVKRCLVPKANEADLEDVPEEISSQMEIIPVESVWQALTIAYPEDREKIRAYLESQNRSS